MSAVSLSAATVNSLGEYLNTAADIIQEEMMSFIPQKEPWKDLYELMRDYPTRGGKKFRSALVLLTSELFGSTIERALPGAVGYELFQNFALIHDDIEDDSLVRRGKPTLHRIHGTPLALNAGDTLYGLVYRSFLSSAGILGDSKTLAIINHFYMINVAPN